MTNLENGLSLFQNNEMGIEVRTIVEDVNNPLFCLKDVCKALDLNAREVIRRLNDEVLSTLPIVDSLGRNQKANFVNEDGLYDVILDSRKPSARKFRKWVTKEVLPSIRQTGGYISSSQQMTEMYFGNANALHKQAITAMFDQMKVVQDDLTKANNQIESQKTDIENKVLEIEEKETEIKIQKLDIADKNVEINELTNNFGEGMTITDFFRQLNGVSMRGNLQLLAARKFLIKVTGKCLYDGRTMLESGWKPTGKTRDWFIYTSSIKKDRSGNPMRSHELKLTEVGVKKLYNRYRAGKLEMIKAWNGEYCAKPAPIIK